MSENKGCLVLAVEIAGELKHGHALHRVGKDHNRGKEVNEGHLTAGEYRPACDAELMRASLALELAARRDRVSVQSAATWANGFAFGLGPAHPAKHLVSLVFAALINRAQGQGPSCC